LDLDLEIRQLFREPVGGKHGAVVARLDVLLDKTFGRRIGDFGRQSWIRTRISDLDNGRIRNLLHAQVVLKRLQQLFFSAQILSGQFRHCARLRIGCGRTSKLPPAVQPEISDHEQGQGAGLQDFHLCVDAHLCTAVVSGLRLGEIEEVRCLAKDRDPRGGIVNRSDAQRCQSRDGYHYERANEYRPFALYQDSPIVADRRFGAGSCVKLLDTVETILVAGRTVMRTVEQLPAYVHRALPSDGAQQTGKLFHYSPELLEMRSMGKKTQAYG
jgi:hypothetical protein